MSDHGGWEDESLRVNPSTLFTISYSAPEDWSKLYRTASFSRTTCAWVLTAAALGAHSGCTQQHEDRENLGFPHAQLRLVFSIRCFLRWTASPLLTGTGALRMTSLRKMRQASSAEQVSIVMIVLIPGDLEVVKGLYQAVFSLSSVESP